MEVQLGFNSGLILGRHIYISLPILWPRHSITNRKQEDKLNLMQVLPSECHVIPHISGQSLPSSPKLSHIPVTRQHRSGSENNTSNLVSLETRSGRKRHGCELMPGPVSPSRFVPKKPARTLWGHSYGDSLYLSLCKSCCLKAWIMHQRSILYIRCCNMNFIPQNSACIYCTVCLIK